MVDKKANKSQLKIGQKLVRENKINNHTIDTFGAYKSAKDALDKSKQAIEVNKK